MYNEPPKVHNSKYFDAVEGRQDTELLTASDLVTLYLRDLGAYKLLTPAQEKALFHRIAQLRQEQGVAAREKLNQLEWKAVFCNAGFVIEVAKKHRGRGLPLPVLAQEGLLGCHRAVKKFDLARGTRFCTYAGHWIRQAMNRALASQVRTVRYPVYIHEALSKTVNLIRKYTETHGAPPDLETLVELWAATGKPITLERAAQLMQYLENDRSLDEPLSSDDSEEFNLYDLLPADSDVVADVSANSLGEEIQAALDKLTERERSILQGFYGLDAEEVTLHDMSVELGLTRERVRQIRNEALVKVKSAAPNLRVYWSQA